MADLRSELRKIIQDDSRIVTEGIEKKYLSDNFQRKRGEADALIFPISTEEVSRLMALAYEKNLPVTPRGAGTNLVGSTVPDGGLVLDFTRMNRVLEIDEETFTATVEPGVILEDFQKLAEERGLFYPPDPGEKKASIGGNISTNAGGMRAVKYGVTRDYVMGLELGALGRYDYHGRRKKQKRHVRIGLKRTCRRLGGDVGDYNQVRAQADT